MLASKELFHCSPELVIVPTDRQRKMNRDIGDLIPSIRARGILMPLLLKEDMTLVAGERRLLTAKFLGLSEIPYRTVKNDISEIEVQIVELEENARRKDLSWQDNAQALLRIHLLYTEQNGEEWTTEQTANALGYDRQHLNKMIDLGEAIAEGDQSVIKAETIANATTLLSRRRARATDEALQRILEIESVPAADLRPGAAGANGEPDAGLDTEDTLGDLREGGGTAEGDDRLPQPVRELPPPYSILCADAHEFLAGYSGPRFNFLHADLPYGVELNEQAGQASFEGEGYDSNPDIYYALMDSILDNWDKFMLPSSHVMWWFAFGQNPEASFYEDTKERFKRKLKHLDIRINPNPLIWHKTDNRGILPDPMRTPRNIGEYALIMSTGDRKLVRPKSNIYGAPTAKAEAIHTNEKPEPMLRHFFEMFVDGHSRVIDPTCGSGSSIRVAEQLKAEAALGLEFNPEFAERANARLIRARGLNKLSASINAAADAAAQSVLDSSGVS